MLDLDLTYLLRLAEDAAGRYGWERMVLWLTAGLIACRYLWRPTRAVGEWYWRLISSPFRSPPDDPLMVAVLQTIRTREADWDDDTRELLVGNVLLTLGSSWRAGGVAAVDLAGIKIGGQDGLSSFADPQRARIAEAAKRLVLAIEAKEALCRKEHLLVRLKADEVPLVAAMPHPLKKDKKGG